MRKRAGLSKLSQKLARDVAKEIPPPDLMTSQVLNLTPTGREWFFYKWIFFTGVILYRFKIRPLGKMNPTNESGYQI